MFKVQVFGEGNKFLTGIIENYLFDLLITTPLNITSMLQTLHSLLMHNSDCIHGFQGKQFVDFGVGLHER